ALNDPLVNDDLDTDLGGQESVITSSAPAAETPATWDGLRETDQDLALSHDEDDNTAMPDWMLRTSDDDADDIVQPLGLADDDTLDQEPNSWGDQPGVQPTTTSAPDSAQDDFPAFSVATTEPSDDTTVSEPDDVTPSWVDVDTPTHDIAASGTDPVAEWDIPSPSDSHLEPVPTSSSSEDALPAWGELDDTQPSSDEDALPAWANTDASDSDGTGEDWSTSDETMALNWDNPGDASTTTDEAEPSTQWDESAEQYPSWSSDQPDPSSISGESIQATQSSWDSTDDRPVATWDTPTDDTASTWNVSEEPEASAWDNTTDDTSPAWGSSAQSAPTWDTPTEDVTPSWDVSDDDAGSGWGAPAGVTPPPPPPSGQVAALPFNDDSGDVVEDTFSTAGKASGDVLPSIESAPPPPLGSGVPMAPEDLPEWMRPDEEPEPVIETPANEEDLVAEEIAAPFNPVIAGVEDTPVAPVRDPSLITAPLPEDEVSPPPGTAPIPGRTTWGQPGPSGIGPAPITSPTLSHPVPDGDQAPAGPALKKQAKGSSVKRILIAVLATLLVAGGAYALWNYVLYDKFFAQSTGVAVLAPGNSSVTFPADQNNQVEWTVETQPGEAFVLTVETPPDAQIGFIAQNTDGEAIGAANTLDNGRNGYRFVAQNEKGGPVTVTARANDSISANVSLHIAPFAGRAETADGVNWPVSIPAGQAATVNIITRGANPQVEVTGTDGSALGQAESFSASDEEELYNAQLEIPAQAGEQQIVITLRTDQAYAATSTVIVDLDN
ncbi:hypothetical protein, partial [Stomatohabitans albus]|uniref:hypothetical protein n=1 Tax=Stomatohabitans albus TaxID=3110766 RepID=UPI00300C9870